MAHARREALFMLAGGIACARPALALRAQPPCPIATPLDTIADRLLAMTPETACYAGIPASQDGGLLARAMDDYTPEGESRWRAALGQALTEAGKIDCGADRWRGRWLDAARAMLENATRSAGIGYGRINAFSYTGHTPYLVTQVSGPLIDTPGIMAAQQSLKTAAAVDAWLEKLDRWPAGFAGVVEKLRADAAAGCRPPAILIARALHIIEAMRRATPDRHPLVMALRQRTAAAGLDRRLRDRAAARAERLIRHRARPAIDNLADTLKRLPTSTEAGLWAQPEGDALYAANVRWLGDTDLSPAEIHRLGKAEVARLSAEMDEGLHRHGLTGGSIGERMAALARDPAQLFPNSAAGREALLEHVRSLVQAMERRYPDILPPDLIPLRPLEVRPVPAEREAGAPGGYYDPPSLDGSRAGIYWINLRDIATVPRLRLPTLSYHEGVPGHHTENSVGQLFGDRPLLLRVGSFNAWQEGWALYAEKLAAEMGVYADDPAGDLGRLQDELFRAARLIVDTGIHAFRWTREQAIAELRTITGIAQSRAAAEVERYMAWPAQALGYKLGQLRLLALRDTLRVKRGPRFRAQAFHAAVLMQGSMPLGMVEEAILG